MAKKKSNAQADAMAAYIASWFREVREFGARCVRFLFGEMRNWGKFGAIVQNNMELGRHHLELGNINDAVLRFKLVTWLDPNHADGWYCLGCSYLAGGKKKSAVVALEKALALKPGDAPMQAALAVAQGKTEAPPAP